MWCLSCGIPYAPEMRFCSHCGQSLAAATTETAADSLQSAPAVGAAAPEPVPPMAPTAETDAGRASEPAPVFPAPILAPVVPPLSAAPQPRGPLSRAGRRSGPASEAEIEAAAAAIVARALAAQQAQAAPPAGDSAGEPGAVMLPEPQPDLALPYTPGPDPYPPMLKPKDRAWLMAGIALCILVVLIALVFTRYVTVVAH
jgi:hypothetical protein